MKKSIYFIALFCCLALTAQAEVAKYCMSYNDFVAGNWKSVDDLTEGRTKRVCQIKDCKKQIRFKTGDKIADKVLKKEAFAVKVGDQLFVNCRNLRNNQMRLDISGYTQAVRFDNDKICVMAHKDNNAMILLSLGADIAGCFIDNTIVRTSMWAGSSALWITNEVLSGKVCYLVDGNTDEKGMIAATRMNDLFMENLLSNDTPLLERYKAVTNKHNRQSAANVLPILIEKGLVNM